MTTGTATLDVRRVNGKGIVDIKGDITAASEDVHMDAYNRTSSEGARAILLNCSGL